MSIMQDLGVNLIINDAATPKLRQFGTQIKSVTKQMGTFVNEFNRMEESMNKSSMLGGKKGGVSSLMNTRFEQPNDILPTETQVQRAQKRMKGYFNNLEEASARYHSTIMAGVALSMTGIGLLNSGRQMLSMWGKLTMAAGQYNEALAKIQLTTGNFGGQSGAKLTASNNMIRQTVTSAGIVSPLSNLQMAQMAQTLSTMGYHNASQLNSLIAPAMMLQAISANGAGGFELNQDQAASLLSAMLRQSGQGIGKMTSTRLGNQTFNGVSSNAMAMVDAMTKAYHTAHLTYADMLSYMNSSGSAISSGNMNIADFLALGGLMKMNGSTAPTAGHSIRGLMLSAQTLDAQQMSKPTSRSQLAHQLGFTVANISKNGQTMTNLLGIYQRALTMEHGNEQQAMVLIHRVANSTGSVVFAGIQKALDNYKKKNGLAELTPQQMVQAIGNSSGYANQRFNVLYQQLPELVKTLKGSLETLGIDLFGPTLNGMAKLVSGINNIVGGLTQWVDKHKTLAKVLGYGLGLTGLLTIATGALFTFTGTMMSGVATLANFRIQMGLLAAKQEHFNDDMITSNGLMKSANEIMGISGLGATIKNMAINFGLFGLAIGGASLAWNKNFGGIKTDIKELASNAQNAFGMAQKAVNDFSNGTEKAFQKQYNDITQSSNNWYKFSKFLVDVAVVFNAFVKSFSNNQLSSSQYNMLNKNGLLPVLDSLLNIKYEVKTFGQGLSEGFKGFGDKLKTALAPFLSILKVFGIDLSGGSGPGAAKNLTGLGDNVGKLASDLLVGMIALRAYSKLIKSVFGLVGGGIRLGKGIGGFFTGGWKDVFKSGGGKLTEALLGKDGKQLTNAIADAVANGIRKGLNTGATETSILEEDTAVATSAPGGMRGWLARRRTKRGLRYRHGAGYHGTTRAGNYEYGTGMNYGYSGYSQGGGDYEQWWSNATNAPHVSDTEIRKMELGHQLYQKYLAEGKEIPASVLRNERAYQAFHGGTMKDYTQARNGRFSKVLWKGRGAYNSVANALGSGSRFGGFMRGTGRYLGGMGKAGMRFLGSGVGRGLGLFGTAAMIGTGMMGTDWSGAYHSGSVGGVVGAGLNTLGIGQKGGVGGAVNGALTGAMTGMMFGPIGAAIGAVIGGALGGIGTDRLKKWINKGVAGIKSWGPHLKKDMDDLGEWGKKAWGHISKFTSPIFNGWKTLMAGEWKVFSSAAKFEWRIVKDIATGNWKDIGKQITGIWDGMKKAFQTAWDGVLSYVKNNPIMKGISNGVNNAVSGTKNFFNRVGNWINGSHAGGLSFVPYDGYIASLHRGERVLTASDARALASGGGGGYQEGDIHLHIEEGAIQVVMPSSASTADAQRVADDIYNRVLKKVQEKNLRNHQPTRMRGVYQG